MSRERVRATQTMLRNRARTGIEIARGVTSGVYRAGRHRAIPIVEGSMTVAGLEGRVDVLRDRYGVPHVFAGSEPDALFGQGFVHAQDRLFQLDGARRLASGRLAEVAGPAVLGSDRFLRRAGLAAAARRDIEELEPEPLARLEAYSSGVNAGIATLPALPPEFAILEYEPEPWAPEHTMLVGRMVMFGFAVNWDTELLRERLSRELGPEQAAALDPVHPPGGHTVTGAGYEGAATRLLDAYRDALEAGLPAGGMSNAWAVAAERSRTGAPLLASDPHVPPSVPGLFHVAHVSGGDFDAIGSTIPGIPGIGIGHNGRFAWGFTAGLANVADCYVEEVDPANPRRYRAQDGWAEAEERIERITVRRGLPVEERVLVTRHGPLIGPAVHGEDRAIALRTTALEPGGIARAFLGLARAQTVEDLDAAVDAWSGTSFNLVFAHVDGTIGYRMAGSVPRNAPGEGLLPRHGSASTGPPPPYDARELPRVIDPPEGLIVSANQAPGSALELGEEWAEPQRAERIDALLRAQPRHSVSSFQRIQNDRHSEHLVRLRDLLIARGAVAEPEGPLLAAWDGQLAPGTPAAAVIGLTYEELARSVTERAAGGAASIALGAGLPGVLSYSSFLYRLQGAIIRGTLDAAAPWYVSIEDRDRQLIGAVARAVDRLATRFGSHPARWRWGAMHPLMLDHPMRAAPAIGRWFSRGRVELGGDVNTVWQAAYEMHRPDGHTRITPGYRQVIDLADFDRSTFIQLTGSSGIPGHPRYDDCLPDFLAGRQRPLLYSRRAVEWAAESWLILDARRDSNGGYDTMGAA
jgi:penicillin G amidase